jgi:hypothetical protein
VRARVRFVLIELVFFFDRHIWHRYLDDYTRYALFRAWCGDYHKTDRRSLLLLARCGYTEELHAVTDFGRKFSEAMRVLCCCEAVQYNCVATLDYFDSIASNTFRLVLADEYSSTPRKLFHAAGRGGIINGTLDWLLKKFGHVNDIFVQNYLHGAIQARHSHAVIHALATYSLVYGVFIRWARVVSDCVSYGLLGKPCVVVCVHLLTRARF